MDIVPSTVPAYSYCPLKDEEVRLISLYPGQQDDDIRFAMNHVPLEGHRAVCSARVFSRRELQKSAPRGWHVFRTPEGRTFYHTHRKGGCLVYDAPPGETRTAESTRTDVSCGDDDRYENFEALSYAWGDISRTHTAYISDASTDTGQMLGIKVTRNLFEALQHLRSLSETRLLWVDAICINQDDIEEKSAQLLRVRHIFGSARRVYVWLGPQSEDSKLALSTLEFLGQQIEISDDWSRFRPNGAQEQGWWDRATPLPYTNEQWRALARFFSRPWFQRLWVIQEITVANQLAVMQCGQDTITWYHCRRAIAALAERPDVPEDVTEFVSNKVDIAHGLRVAALRDVIFTCRQHHCSDPRDKIFSILGFLGEELRGTVVPSYRSNFEGVYRTVFLHYAKITGRLDLLQQCFLESTDLRRPTGLPSWVPDWRSFPAAFRHAESGYQAAGMSKAEYSVDGDTLKATGKVCDVVTHVFGVAGSEESSLVENIRELSPDGLHTDLYVTGETKFEAWVRTLVLDLLWERFAQASHEDLDFWDKQIRQVLSHPETDPPVKMEAVNELVRDTWTNMRFFNTGDGHFGFGPVAMQAGDQVCILLGLPTPIIVRPQKDGCFQVVGWCYVHGLMDGEALLGLLPRNWYVWYHWHDGRYTAKYVRARSRVMRSDDPRSETLPSQWERIEVDHTADDPVCVQYFRNTNNGEVINYDPRMTSEALARRGVMLEKLRFI